MSDLINRQDAIDAICEHGTELERRGITVLAVANHKAVTIDLLENLPTATERKGGWIVKNHVVCCSECGEPNMEWNYYPNCGADMRGE